MAEEKILTNEIIDDAELENVAGGTTQETLDDRRRLQKMGAYDDRKGMTFAQKVQSSFNNLGKTLGLDIQLRANVKLAVPYQNDYFLNGEKISREEFWAIIDEAVAANK